MFALWASINGRSNRALVPCHPEPRLVRWHLVQPHIQRRMMVSEWIKAIHASAIRACQNYLSKKWLSVEADWVILDVPSVLNLRTVTLGAVWAFPIAVSSPIGFLDGPLPDCPPP
jgi:hypothetical protein